MRLIDADALKEEFAKNEDRKGYLIGDWEDLIDNTPTVELDESVIQAVLNKRCMTVVSNEFLIALHDKRPTGHWIDHSEDEGYLECPICGCLTNSYGNKEELFYCWHCGAEMRGIKNEQNKDM